MSPLSTSAEDFLTRGVENILSRVSRIDQIETERLARAGELSKSMMPGIKAGSARRQAEMGIRAARALAQRLGGPRNELGWYTDFTLRNNAVLEIHFRNKFGQLDESLRMPLQTGMAARVGRAKSVASQRFPTYGGLIDPIVEAKLTQAQYVTRGFVTTKGDRAVVQSMGERMLQTMVSGMQRFGGDPKAVSGQVNQLNKAMQEVFETSIFGTSLSVLPAEERLIEARKVGLPMHSPGAVLYASQMQVLSPGGTPLADSLKLEGEGFPFTVEKGMNVRAPQAHMQAYRERLVELGLKDRHWTELLLKPEAALRSYISAISPGAAVPFGHYADPTRQLYQRWMVAPLVTDTAEGLGKRYVTTKGFEAAKAITGGPGTQYWRPTKIMFATPESLGAWADPAEAGGLIVSPQLLKDLRHTTSEGKKITPGVGSALMLDAWKGTVTGTARFSDQVDAITNATLLKKHPDVLRKFVISDILQQLTKGGRRIPKTGTKAKFLQDLADIVKGEVYYHSNKSGSAKVQLQVGAKSRLGSTGADDELSAILNRIAEYNKTAPDAIKPGFKLETIAAVPGSDAAKNLGATTITGYVMHGEMAARLNQELEDINKVVGNYRGGVGARGGVAPMPEHLGGVVINYSAVRGRGMKVRFKDVVNVGLHGTPESAALAGVMMSVIEGSEKMRKRDIFKVITPLLGTHRIAGGIDPETLAETVRTKFSPDTHYIRKLSREEKTLGLTKQALEMTSFDPSHPMYQGFTLNLASPLRMEGVKGEGHVWTKQIHIPGVESLDFAPTHRTLASGLQEERYFLNPLLRSRQRVVQAVLEGKGDYQGAVDDFMENYARAVIGESGYLRALAEPRVAQSGYFRMVAKGGKPFGPQRAPHILAEMAQSQMKSVKLATGEVIPADAVAWISRADVKAMDALGEFEAEHKFAPKGYAWMRQVRYPAQGPAHEAMLLTKMVDRAEAETLGPGGMGVSQRFATHVRGDFDADNLAAMVISGKRGQEISYRYAIRHTIPDLVREAAKIDAHLGTAESMVGTTSQIVPSPKIFSYKEFLKMAKDHTSYMAHMENYVSAARVGEYYTTKTMMGPLDWWASQMKNIMYVRAEDQGRRAGAEIVNEIAQQAAMAKGADVSKDAAAMVDFFANISKQALQEGGEFTAEESKKMVDYAIRLHTAAVEKGQGGLQYLSKGELSEGVMAYMKASKTFRMGMAAGGAPPGLMNLAHKSMTGAEMSGTQVDKIMKHFGAAAELGAGLEAKEFEIQKEYYEKMFNFIGMMDDKAAFEKGSALVDAPKHAGVAADIMSRQAAGAEGEALPQPLIDKVGSWFRSPKTPAYQKVGVVAGSALLAGAVVKNLLMPGFSPGEDTSPAHVAVPIPVRMPGLESPQMPGIFGRDSSPTAVDSTFSMPPDYVNMGTRTPLPAVQMGAGTMQPGVLPKFVGNILRDAPQAPLIINESNHQQLAEMGMPAPQTARVSEPLPPMLGGRSGFDVRADAPGQVDMRRLQYLLSQFAGDQYSINTQTSSAESELSILQALEESEHSGWM